MYGWIRNQFGRQQQQQPLACVHTHISQASPNIVIALAGNKADLTNSRVVEFEEAKQYAEENGLLFMETSAKTAMNVNDIFLAIGMQQMRDLSPPPPS